MRRVPTLINRGYGSAFFWDGRAATLEDQVLQPIANPNELGTTVQEAIARVDADPTYRADFQRAFQTGPDAQTMARALASYVRSIVSGNSLYDRFIKGDATAMTAQQQRGLELFKGKANCVTCHSGPNFTDEQFHNTGVAYRTGALRDEGRYAYTHIASDLGAFKTPTLRDVAESAPYMHDGSISTLKDIVDFYDLNGIANPYLDPKIHPLHLSDQEKTDLIAFLGALSGSAN
jgi:cytochrome c peroxidase